VSNDDKLGAGCAIAFFGMWAVAVFGWCANIYKLALSINEPLTALTVMRVLGIPFAPMGTVLGFV
jgi:hypothetical protein